MASVIGIYFVKVSRSGNAYTAINNGNYLTCALTVLGGFLFTRYYLQDMSLFWAVMVGPVAGVLVGLASEYYTSDEENRYRCWPLRQKRAATTIIDGMAIGMKSTVLPIIITAAAVLIAYRFGGFFGLALSAVSMLSISGITIAVDAYGP